MAAHHDDLHVAEVAPVATTTEPVAMPVVAIAPAVQAEAHPPAPAPVAAAPRPVRVEPYALPTDALQTLAADVGLEWVNSDAEKIRAVQAAMAAEPAPIRVPREPRRHMLADDGPLVLVETRKDLSQLKLPFEQGAAH